MSFAERYAPALTRSLQDDEHHSATQVLIAAALADQSGSGDLLGSLLCRVKYGDGIVHKTFEAGSGNLAQLVRIWHRFVAVRGKSRCWLPVRNEWDISAAEKLYSQVAEVSLAQWLDGSCPECRGSGTAKTRQICDCCKGSGKSPIRGHSLVAERSRDMLSELEGMYQAHGARANKLLRAA